MKMRFVYVRWGVVQIVAWCRAWRPQGIATTPAKQPSGVLQRGGDPLRSPGCLLVLLAFLLAACSFIGGGPTTSSSTEQLAPTSPGLQLGAQPCPAAVQDPAHWNAIVGLGTDQTVERVICGNLVGLPTLQAVVGVRHMGSDHILDIFIYSHITGSTPTQLFTLRGLLHGDVKISGYNTVLTVQSDPHSSLNKGLPPAEFEQDLFREFKWSDRALTFVEVAFSGIFPDLTRFQAEREQAQVNNGQGFQQWRLSVVKSAQTFASSFLNWPPDVPVTVLSGGGVQDYKAIVQVRNTTPGGGIVRISFSRLEGNNNGGIWEATAIDADGLSITSPQSGQSLTSPITVAGTNTASAGKMTIIKVLDHVHNDIGHVTVAAPGTNGEASFSSNVPYISSFQGGGQEGIIALYTYNANGSVAAVAMVKVLLGA